jgi:hypothetical protein
MGTCEGFADAVPAGMVTVMSCHVMSCHVMWGKDHGGRGEYRHMCSWSHAWFVDKMLWHHHLPAASLLCDDT